MNSKLRLLLDLGPLLVFFLAYRLGGLMVATLAIILCTLMSLAVTYLLEKRIAAMPLVSGIAITLLGGLTLFLHDETFIKVKPTLVNLTFALIILGGLYMQKPVLRYLLGHALQITEAGWKKLSLRWGCFFLFLAGLNEAVWRNFPTDFWVDFKVFGMFTLTLLFTIAQVPLIKKHWHETKEEEA